MRSPRTTFAAAVLGLALALASTSAAAPQKRPLPVLSASCHGHSFKPGRIVLACGDAGLIVERLRWRHWGHREANGVGTGVGRTCSPSCAAGGTRSASMEIRLYQPRFCRQDGLTHFTKMRYRWTHGSPIANTPNAGVIPSACSAV